MLYIYVCVYIYRLRIFFLNQHSAKNYIFAWQVALRALLQELVEDLTTQVISKQYVGSIIKKEEP